MRNATAFWFGNQIKLCFSSSLAIVNHVESFVQRGDFVLSKLQCLPYNYATKLNYGQEGAISIRSHFVMPNATVRGRVCFKRHEEIATNEAKSLCFARERFLVVAGGCSQVISTVRENASASKKQQN